MTLSASREGDNITVRATYSTAYSTANFEITEHYQHINHFWGQLGELVSEARQEDHVKQDAALGQPVRQGRHHADPPAHASLPNLAGQYPQDTPLVRKPEFPEDGGPGGKYGVGEQPAGLATPYEEKGNPQEDADDGLSGMDCHEHAPGSCGACTEPPDFSLYEPGRTPPGGGHDPDDDPSGEFPPRPYIP